MVSTSVLCESGNSQRPLDDDHYPLPYKVEIRPTAEFSYEGALNKLLNLPSFAKSKDTVQLMVPGETSTYSEDFRPEELGLTNRRGKILQLSAWLDLDNKASLGCAGAILCYLQRRRSARPLLDDPDSNLAFRIAGLEMFSLRGSM